MPGQHRQSPAKAPRHRQGHDHQQDQQNRDPFQTLCHLSRTGVDEPLSDEQKGDSQPDAQDNGSQKHFARFLSYAIGA